MSDFLRRINQRIQKKYKVTVEITLNETPIHQQEITVNAYHRSQAIKRALAMVHSNTAANAISTKRVKR